MVNIFIDCDSLSIIKSLCVQEDYITFDKESNNKLYNVSELGAVCGITPETHQRDLPIVLRTERNEEITV